LGLFFLAFFVEKKSCAQITVDQRYSTQTRFYSRIFFEKNLVKEFGMIAGYNVDGRGIAHLQASYEVFDGIKYESVCKLAAAVPVAVRAWRLVAVMVVTLIPKGRAQPTKRPLLIDG
jgi:hypothetical protein